MPLLRALNAATIALILRNTLAAQQQPISLQNLKNLVIFAGGGVNITYRGRAVDIGGYLKLLRAQTPLPAKASLSS